MNRTIICLGLVALLGGSHLEQGRMSLMAQSSLPSPQRRTEALALERSVSRSFLGWQHLDLLPATSFVATEQREYLDVLASIALDRGTEEVDILALELMSRVPGGIDYQRARLLATLYIYERHPESSTTISRLSRIDTSGLWRYEQEQCHTMLGYLLLTRQSDARSRRTARERLALAARGSSEWSDRAALYLATLEWADGRPALAQEWLQTRRWQSTSLIEAEYLSALLSYAVDRPSTALAHAQQSIARYPLLAERPRLIGAEGQALYALGEYDQAIRTLLPVGQAEVLLPAESYALGASLYQRGRYSEARVPLQDATRASGEIAPLAQLALGYLFRGEGQLDRAQMAFASVLTHEDATPSLREQALYEQIELGFSASGDAFGQQIRNAETFLQDYPNSPHRARVIDLLRSHLSTSTDYAGSIALIDRMQGSGESLRGIRQEVLVRWASALPTGDSAYLPRLTEAIGLVPGSEAQTIALVMRSAEYLRTGRYAEAGADAELALSRPYGAQYEEGIARYLLGYARYNLHRYSEATAPLTTFARGGAAPQLRADALVRLADIRLRADSKSADAIALYREATKLSPTGSDEALYRISSIYGQRGAFAEQITAIGDLEREHPHSTFLPQALYDRGRAELLGERQPDRAIATLALVEERYPASALAPRAALETALIESNRDRTTEAIAAYRRVILRYPDSREATTALEDLRSLYAERNELDVYAEYVSTLSGKLRPQTDDEAHLAYISLESRARRGVDVAQELEAFVARYPRARDLAEAQTLLVREHVARGRRPRAIELLSQMADVAPNAGKELPLRLQLGDLLTDEDRLSEAAKAYERALVLSVGTPAQSKRAGLALSRTAMKLKDYATIRKTATPLLQRTDLTTGERGELLLLRGQAEQHTRDTEAALQTYAQLSDESATAYGAEATVHRGTLLLSLGRTDEAQRVMTAFVGSGTPQQYWLARAFVVLADTYERQGEWYLAEQYIRSLQEGYTGSEADIQEMIQTRLTRYEAQTR